MNAGLVQRAATIGSCPVLYGQSVIGGSEFHSSGAALVIITVGEMFGHFSFFMLLCIQANKPMG